MAGLLDIRVTKKVTITCSLEESIAIQVDQYAAFANVPADEVVNKALEYVFSKDKEFQRHQTENPNGRASAGLRVKKPISVSTGAKRGRRPTLVKTALEA